MDKVIEWDDPIQKPFHGKILSLAENVTPEQAFRCEPHYGVKAYNGEVVELSEL
ncbi:hypothetical protein J2S13_003268 [Oikeobacillus pervagus]|uniref:Uncharacterized protein n=1 Tax=Oikeobacillus pervagus TaxID=1325931 RepID=A0AAJ1WI02_9BACI|nr:hypothetical protein [Oikeobacillus pervagus]MDQ0216782.1 hypothetical protein [Oikeobacillus pervagus]